MGNREKVIAAIKKANNKELNQELGYFIDFDSVDDLADALNWAEDFADGHDDRRMQKVIRKILIEAGCYVYAPENTTALGCDSRFQVDGKKYDFPHDGGWEDWINK